MPPDAVPFVHAHHSSDVQSEVIYPDGSAFCKSGTLLPGIPVMLKAEIAPSRCSVSVWQSLARLGDGWSTCSLFDLSSMGFLLSSPPPPTIPLASLKAIVQIIYFFLYSLPFLKSLGLRIKLLSESENKYMFFLYFYFLKFIFIIFRAISAEYFSIFK